ncbi:MAG TPA: hypothetical protein VK817_09230 [Trebonia sp.]|jgi:hypothetical protein|nr:hypothetical protein [Trebonia sp.]
MALVIAAAATGAAANIAMLLLALSAAPVGTGIRAAHLSATL